jgi:hypothetical protein
MRRRGLIAALMGLGVLAGPPAHASQTLPVVLLQCRGEEAVVRFEYGDAVAPLPGTMAERWRDVPFAGTEGCTLSGGEAVMVLQGALQTSEYGGGADPPGFISLWIGGKKVFSREFYKGGYGSHGLTHNSILYAPGSLTRCTYPQATMEYIDLAKVTCAQTRMDVAAMPIDPQAPTATMLASFGELSVMSVSSEAFCRGFVKPHGYGRDSSTLFVAKKQSLAPPPGTQFPLSASGKDADDPFGGNGWKPGDFAGPLLRYAVRRFDLTNSGEEQTVLRLWASSKAFYGDIYLYRKGVASQAEIDAVIKAQPTGSDIHLVYRKLAAETGWFVAFAPDEVYSRIYAMPLRIEGVTYLFAYSIEVEDTPTATLYRMKPDNRPETVCTFQELRPPF